MIDLQYVVLYVSSFVILFHRGRKSGRRKTGKSEEKSKEKHRIKGAEKGGHHEWQAQGKKTAGPPRNRQGENRIMQSCERAVFSPRFLVPLYKTGRRFLWGDVDGVIHWDIKYGKIPLSDCFLSCPMRRRSLRLLSPGTSPQLGRRYRNVFSGEKNYRREFLPRKPGVERGRYRPLSYSLEGTWQAKRVYDGFL